MGARNERASENDAVSSGVIRCTAPIEAVTAFESREACRVWKTESVDCGYGFVWILL